MSNGDPRLVLGFYHFTPLPGIHAAAPAPVNVQHVTIGGPRTRKQIEAEIEACKKMLTSLEWELAHTLPEQPLNPTGEPHG